MLTKQEREATIERIKSYGDSDLPFYKLLFGSRAPYAMQYTEYLKALKDRVIDLCDTSNMIELPLDKDGEVIRIGDVVYDNNGEELEDTSLEDTANSENAYCSFCGYEMMTGEEGWFDYERKEHGNLLIPNFNYCPNCGARVVRDEA